MDGTGHTRSCPDAAILALLAGDGLGARKRERTRAHLAGCPTCRLALRRVEVVRGTLREVAQWTPPAPTAAGNARLEATLRWTRMDPPLEPADGEGGARRSPRTVFWSGAAAAAAAAVLLAGATGFFLLRHQGRVTQARLLAGPRPAPLAQGDPATQPAPGPSQPAEAAVTLLRGEATLVMADGTKAPLDLRRPLRQGDRIVTAEGARLAFQWGEGSGALLEGGSELRLARLETRAQELALARGRIAVRVGPHQPGESLRVRSPDHDVTVHGTWFIVGVQPRGTQVEVLEGVVEVGAPTGDAASTRLPAPSRATFRRGTGVADGERALTGREAQALRAASEMGLLAWPGFAALHEASGVLQVTSAPSAQLVVDGVSFGATPLSLLRPRGRHLVELSRAGFATVRRWVGVGDGPIALEAALEVEPRLHPTVPPLPDEVRAVVSSRQRQVSACYERALKRDPELAGTVTLQLRIGPAGQVLGSRVGDDTLKEPQVTNCLRHETAGWLFATARNATLAYPFVFRPF